jgi:4-diphosphocytidyl-2-C-methyl-D-erythritol kinase
MSDPQRADLWLEHAGPDAWTRWPAPAKLNLFLQVVGRRNDGYHDLQTVFQLLDWGDEIALRVRDDGLIRRGIGAEGVQPDQDLTVRAAHALREATGSRCGADIEVVKRIPLGGGFGGGSSDAATVLVGLNELWGTSLNFAEIAAIGVELGADVPVFVRGRSAWAEGIGEQLQPIELPSRWFVVVDTGVRVSTAELFQSAELTRDARSATISDFVSGNVRGNAFEPVLRRRAPVVAQALDELARHGAAQLTGTGGGIFASFEDMARAEQVRDALPPGWSVRVAEGVNVSPLHRRLAALRGG